MSRGSAAARLAAKLHEARMRRLGELSPMDRSARIARLRDEIELHPERERDLLAHIEELETSMTEEPISITDRLVVVNPLPAKTVEVATDDSAAHDTDMSTALDLLRMRMAGQGIEPLLDDLRKAYAVVRELRVGPASAADAEAVRGDPAVPVRKSVRHDAVACLECGAELKTLKRHLRTAHRLDPAAYRARWGLEASHPIVAPAYTAVRSDLAKAAGLGRKGA